MEVALGIIATVILALIGVVWKQMNDKMDGHKEHCDGEIAHLWDQVGRDSESGMRKRLHNSVSMGAHMDLEKRVDAIERTE